MDSIPATEGQLPDEKKMEHTNGHATITTTAVSEQSKEKPVLTIQEPASGQVCSLGDTDEFTGDVETNDKIPSRATLRQVDDLLVLDEEGQSLPFKQLYSGPKVARRVLLIFIRHFFCGNCQEYVRTLTTSILPSTLLALPIPTSIAVIGCGSPGLISMYREETGCPFPIYCDPSKKLYDALGMQRTLVLGARPEYQRRGTLLGMVQSIRQGFGQLMGGKVFEVMDMHQVGGEFLFEPVKLSVSSPSSPTANGETVNGTADVVSPDEEKRITWCHRMRNTRDHAEIPELREVLGLEGEGTPGNDRKRWLKALGERKGLGLSTTQQRRSGSVNRQGEETS